MIAVYVGDLKHPREPIQRLLNRANQALQTLERYKNRLDTVSGSLSALEVEDLVTVRDVATVLQRAEMVRRIAEEIEGYIVELGTDGRLVLLQLEELMGGVEDDRRLVIKDYSQADDTWQLSQAMSTLADLSTEDLLDLKSVMSILHLPADAAELDMSLQPRGYRLLSKIPRLPDAVIERIVDAARDTATQAGLSPQQIDALYFTGGSTGLRLLAQRISAAFPTARTVRGDRFASVVSGLALHAQRLFGREPAQ